MKREFTGGGAASDGNVIGVRSRIFESGAIGVGFVIRGRRNGSRRGENLRGRGRGSSSDRNKGGNTGGEWSDGRRDVRVVIPSTSARR
jgi:hypothetical protein